MLPDRIESPLGLNWQVMATNFLELFADASFCAGADRSQSGMILQWNDAPVAWLSPRQPTASLSTAEAELQAGIDCMTLAEGFTELFRELEGTPLKCVLYGDNQGAVTVLQIPQGAWRTRHLRLKASWFLQQVEDNKYPVYHVPGQFMLGDICTKTLSGQRVRELLQLMGVAVVKDEGESDKVGIKNMSLDSGGVPIKSSGVPPSESTRGLKNCRADFGEVVPECELIGTFVESGKGEGVTNHPGIPSMGLIQRALKLLLGAACLRRSQGKLTITVDQVEPDRDTTAWVIALLAVLGVVLLCLGLTVGAWCGARNGEGPRIRSMRATETSSERDGDEWSLVSESSLEAPGPPQAQGLRRRPQRARSYTDPVSQFPRLYPNPPEDEAQGLSREPQGTSSFVDPTPQVPRSYLIPSDEEPEARAPPQAQGLHRSPQGPVTSPDPASQDPRYPNPRYETLRAPAAGSSRQLRECDK